MAPSGRDTGTRTLRVATSTSDSLQARIEGVIDVGVIFISHREEPLEEADLLEVVSFQLLRDA